MGWCNYLILDEYELSIELDKNCNKRYLYSVIGRFERIVKEVSRISDFEEDLDNKDVSRKVLNSIENLGFKAWEFLGFPNDVGIVFDIFIFLAIDARGIHYDILTLEEMSDKQKGYKIIPLKRSV
ncbi:MAG: hypothetical protein ACOC5T_09570 [Elusimicrobiota bacterium]